MKTKKLFLLLANLSMTLTAVGCGGGGEPQIEYDFTESEETIEYTIWGSGLQLYTHFTNKDRVIKFLENKFNVKLNLAGASASWRDKLISIVSDYKDVPDLFFCVPSESYFVDWVDDQILWDLNGYLDKANATTLKAMFNTNQFKGSTEIRGKNYFVPCSTGYTNHSLIVRKDWMNKWNVERQRELGSYPTTVSEFTDMLTFFRENDPDGDGRKNTYGLALSNNFDFTQDLLGSFGIKPNFTKNSDGSYSLSAYGENYDSYINWLKAGNSTGYIYPSFYALSEDECRTALLQGRAGAAITNGDRFFDGLYVELRNIDPDNYLDMLDVIPFPNSDDGKYKGQAVGYPFYWGGWCIPTTVKEPMRLVKMMDYLMSEEGQKLLVYGVEDIHYTTDEEGKIIPNYKERLKDDYNAFFCSDVQQGEKPDGRYSVGEVILPSPFKIIDNNIVTNMPYDTYFNNGEIVKKYYSQQEQQGVNLREPQWLIDDVDKMDSWNKVVDYVKSYTINVVAGKDQTKQLNELKSLCSNADLDGLLDYLKNHK